MLRKITVNIHCLELDMSRKLDRYESRGLSTKIRHSIRFAGWACVGVKPGLSL